jgi:hypothetical protein
VVHLSLLLLSIGINVFPSEQEVHGSESLACGLWSQDCPCEGHLAVCMRYKCLKTLSTNHASHKCCGGSHCCGLWIF